MEERFCQLVKQLGCTCITISHRPALMAFHDIVLALDGEGGWSLHPGHRSLEAKAEAAALQAPQPSKRTSEFDAGFVVPPPSRLGAAGRGSGKFKAKARGSDAATVLQSMAAGATEQEEMLGDGNEGFSGEPLHRAQSSHAATLSRLLTRCASLLHHIQSAWWLEHRASQLLGSTRMAMPGRHASC